MGDEHEAAQDHDRDRGDLRDHDELRAPEVDRRTDTTSFDGADPDAFLDEISSMLSEAEDVTQRAADQRTADLEQAAADREVQERREAANRSADDRTSADPLPEARRAADAPEPPSPNHPAEELRWLEVEQRMIARALDDAGISYSKRTIEMIAYDASDRRAVDIALRAMDALYEGGEPS